MSRSGYTDDDSDGTLNLWRGAVDRALKGKRGQQLLRELADAMDAMPEKVLIADELQDAEGDFCALGVVGKARGIDMSNIDTEDRDQLSEVFNIAPAMAAEVMFINDDEWYRAGETPQQRWVRVRRWVNEQLNGKPIVPTGAPHA